VDNGITGISKLERRLYQFSFGPEGEVTITVPGLKIHECYSSVGIGRFLLEQENNANFSARMMV